MDTNTFHLPFGEISITLDDVSCLLHLPIVGQFLTYDNLYNSEFYAVLLELLGVEDGSANVEMRQCHDN